ncbi:peptide MFS transporter [Deinococcus maricopensis]|uniref:Amino acid/peptide transporter n=1 Tax=Deinococcus maricopensis (strain DSM 21211 / LMG 22137 / NRRL B-23946 / LB-34) TaxID=709986 RepID=E8U699_DEIML|nr:oligopeptide:H+ symporter [Deinococcus maricopensis]ADV66588.1 amino acid/peptide transporter [Deinococcus maricopensis DSM 21211]
MTHSPSRAGTPERDARFLGQPLGLSVLFATELWERFSFYGMRALLPLFLATSAAQGGLGYSDAQSASTYAIYNALVYLAALPGGFIADRLIGARRAVLWGGLTIAAGHFTMAVPGTLFFFLGLLLIMLGTGLLKPNISAMVGQLYAHDDTRRDAGFSLFYMGINLGAFLAPLVCGYLGQKINWHLGFAAAGVGMLLGLAWYVLGGRHLGQAGLQPGNPLAAHERAPLARQVALGVLAVLVAGALLRVFLPHINPIDVLTFVVFGATLWVFANVLRGGRLNAEDRRRMTAFVWLFLASALFWMIYDQGGSLLGLFAEQKTNRTLLGFQFPASWYQSLNPMFILVFAPLFAALWLRLGARQPSTPVKFVYGLGGVGASFLLMGLAAHAASGGHLISPLWLVGVYLLQTLAELTLSPTGLSVATKLAPASLSGQMLGVWFLATSVGNAIGAQVARLSETLSPSGYFTVVGALAVAAAVVLLFGARPIARLMGGVK